MRELLAHVQFRGVIRERSVEPYLRLLRAIGDRRRIRGVLFDISSGGGGSVPSMDLYLAVKRLGERKPVVASIASVGASGAYMAALGARRVFAYPDSAVGSIGVVAPHVAVKGLLDKVGIDVELLHHGRHKDAFQGLRPLTEEERTKVLRATEDGYRGFVDLVARERHLTVEQVQPLATGEVWSGAQALGLGLIDALGDREMALEELSRLTGVPRHKVVRAEPPRGFLERMFAPSLQWASESFRSGLSDAVEDLAYDGVYGRWR